MTQTTSGATLAFELQSLAGEQMHKAELAGGSSSAVDVTDKLHAALKNGKTDASIELDVSNPEPQDAHLRVWIETEPMAGKLVQTTLLPAGDQLDLRKVGGPGQEFMSGGRNWPATPVVATPMGGTEAGAWRVEIGDHSGAAATRFLNVYQVMDADARSGPVRAVKGRGLIGASVGGRMFVASETEAPLAAGASFEVTADDVGKDGQAMVVMTDLPAGDHSLWQGEALIAAGAVEIGVHTWIASLRPGRYELKSR